MNGYCRCIISAALSIALKQSLGLCLRWHEISAVGPIIAIPTIGWIRHRIANFCYDGSHDFRMDVRVGPHRSNIRSTFFCSERLLPFSPRSAIANLRTNRWICHRIGNFCYERLLPFSGWICHCMYNQRLDPPLQTSAPTVGSVIALVTFVTTGPMISGWMSVLVLIGPISAAHSSVVNGFCRSADGPPLQTSAPTVGSVIALVTFVINGYCRCIISAALSIALKQGLGLCLRWHEISAVGPIIARTTNGVDLSLQYQLPLYQSSHG